MDCFRRGEDVLLSSRVIPPQAWREMAQQDREERNANQAIWREMVAANIQASRDQAQAFRDRVEEQKAYRADSQKEHEKLLENQRQIAQVLERLNGAP